ncbi:hypothetical protein [Thiocapsa imhoffii]|uniref:hypothetical protein n=1 Tax=Thiocapsa imhoffii TaxID=382777 RepID=UPI00190362B6|nr:hypothetical protein [Thiocapsa imhoffii]
MDRLSKLFKRQATSSVRHPGSFRHHFIHIPKNGGTSVRRALSGRGDVSLGDPYHSRYIDVVEDIGQGLSYFSVVRNPWSRTASRYYFARQTAKSWNRHDPRKLYIDRATFSDYIHDQKIFQIPEHPDRPWMGPMNSWFNQLDWVTDADGVVQCSCLRLEHLSEDLETYFGEPVTLLRENETKTRYALYP